MGLGIRDLRLVALSGLGLTNVHLDCLAAGLYGVLIGPKPQTLNR